MDEIMFETTRNNVLTADNNITSAKHDIQTDVKSIKIIRNNVKTTPKISKIS